MSTFATFAYVANYPHRPKLGHSLTHSRGTERDPCAIYKIAGKE